MSFSNSSSIAGSLQQLKEIVTSVQGEDHEATHLVQQMECLAREIERKQAITALVTSSNQPVGAGV